MLFSIDRYRGTVCMVHCLLNWETVQSCNSCKFSSDYQSASFRLLMLHDMKHKFVWQ
jgi:hypothetical protein